MIHSSRQWGRALACVMGDMDLVRPLGLAGICCAVVAPPGAPTRFSRFVRATIDWVDPWERADEMVEVLRRFGAAQPEPPILFYHSDEELLLVSRYRERLAQAFRFVVPEATLVEDLVDKGRFQALADRLALPVPATRLIAPGESAAAADLGLRFPVVIKPAMHGGRRWRTVCAGKALRVNTPEALREFWPILGAAGFSVLVQELVPGPETSIESYHVYVDVQGDIVGEFTGRKVRTYPIECGHSTALVITDVRDVAALGRELVRRLGLRGVAKFDFKRTLDGKLYLLEINPRFQLWHHPGAVAGVNLPALVYADLVGMPRSIVPHARPGVRWCNIWADVVAARACGVPLAKWLPWAFGCEAKAHVAWDDPMPFLCGALYRLFRHRLGRATSGNGKKKFGG